MKKIANFKKFVEAGVFWRLASATGASTRNFSAGKYPCSKKTHAEKEFFI